MGWWHFEYFGEWNNSKYNLLIAVWCYLFDATMTPTTKKVFAFWIAVFLFVVVVFCCFSVFTATPSRLKWYNQKTPSYLLSRKRNKKQINQRTTSFFCVWKVLPFAENCDTLPLIPKDGQQNCKLFRTLKPSEVMQINSDDLSWRLIISY